MKTPRETVLQIYIIIQGKMHNCVHTSQATSEVWVHHIVYEWDKKKTFCVSTLQR